jgi:PAS domain S-box-containing protein
MQTEVKTAMPRAERRLAMVVAEIAGVLASATTAHADRAINGALSHLGGVVDVDRTYLFRNDHGSGTLSNTHEWCAPGVTPEIERLQDLPQSAFPYSMSEFLEGRPVVANTLDALPADAAGEKEILEVQGIRSVVLVPVFTPSGLDGFMGYDSVNRVRRWSADEVELLRIVSGLVGTTLHRVDMQRAHDEETRQNLARVQAAERKLRAIFGTIDDTIVLHDAEGKILAMNNAGRERLGFPVPGSLPATVFDIEHGVSPDHLRGVWSDATPDTVFRVEGVHGSDAVEHYPVSVVVTCFDLDGERTFVAVARDISDEKRMRNQLEAQRRDLRRLNTVVEEIEHACRAGIARRVHDEIGHELAIAQLNLDTAPQGANGESVNRARGAIQRAIIASRAVMSDLAPPAFEERGLFAGLDEFIARSGSEHAPAVFASFSGEDETLSPAARRFLYQAGCELILNARKHAAAERVSVSVEISVHNATLTVCDNGAGLDPRAESRRAGYGMMLVEQRARLLNGTVRWCSRPDFPGTRCEITVPTGNGRAGETTERETEGEPS